MFCEHVSEKNSVEKAEMGFYPMRGFKSVSVLEFLRGCSCGNETTHQETADALGSDCTADSQSLTQQIPITHQLSIIAGDFINKISYIKPAAQQRNLLLNRTFIFPHKVIQSRLS